MSRWFEVFQILFAEAFFSAWFPEQQLAARVVINEAKAKQKQLVKSGKRENRFSSSTQILDLCVLNLVES